MPESPTLPPDAPTATDEGSPPSRPGSPRRRILAVLTGLVIALLFVEVGLRIATTTHKGQETVFGVPLLPLTPPRLRASEAEYIGYDPDCGWAPMPLGKVKESGYFADQFGLRAAAAEPREPPADALRVMLCGDSFAHSDEVMYEESLGAAIESARPQTWVQIAGVPAFGIDQAWLRYRKLAPVLQPRIVIIGVHQNDFMRNVALWTRSGLSKPRFVLNDGGALELINCPPIAGEELQRQFEAFEGTLFARHQFFHVTGAYESRSTDSIRSLRFLRSLGASRIKSARYRATVSPGSRNEVHQIAQAVVTGFAREVIDDGAVPIVVTLPSASHLVYLEQDADWWSAPLIAACKDAGCAFIDVTPLLRAEVDSGSVTFSDLFTRGGAGHFTAAGNRKVAELLLPEIGRAADTLNER